ncbi:MAG TPA: chemotaxis response regulator protein-glutamate methylesterase [Patescibacteria group bacterium]|nr:chemotaxis response regulator protein-glutamate methylesterase [Patescibacteria group bacterium]
MNTTDRGKPDRRIKVLVVDDSLLFRETLARRMGEDRGIVVVGTASDVFSARDMILDLEPDVMTLDVEMPKMNGIEFLRRLMPQYPLPVVVVSAANERVFDALDAGAVDFVRKPDGSARGMEAFAGELIVKIKIASMAKVGQRKREYNQDPVNSVGGGSRDVVVAIGASTGGTEAIYEVVRGFPRDMPGVVIVQHMPPVFTRMYANRLNDNCRMEAKEAENGDSILPGRILVAPGDCQMRVRRRGNLYTVECFQGPKVNGHCPSVDVLFDSVADTVGAKAVGIILTGMGYDGAKGLMKMRRSGAYTVGQDEESSVVYGMPKVAYDIGAVVRQSPLRNISQVVCSAVSGSR